MQSGLSSAIIYAVRAKRLFSKGCQKYLAHVVLNDVVWSSVNNVERVRLFLMSSLKVYLDCLQAEI